MKKTESFILGLTAAVAALICTITLTTVINFLNPNFSQSLFFIILAIIVEEIFKFLFLLKIIKKSTFLLRNAFFLGLGFSLIELIFILLGDYPVKEIIPAMLQISIIHISTSVIITKIIKFNPLSFSKKILALIIAFVVHLTYNLTALQEKGLFFAILFGVLTLMFITFKKNKKTTIAPAELML